MATIKYGESKVFFNGERYGHIVRNADSFSTSTKPEWDFTQIPNDLNLEFKMTDEQRAFFKKVQDEMFEQLELQNKAIESWVEDCVRTRVVPPIKGKITRGKVKWRGLALCWGPEWEFLGLLQRGKTLYHVDGNTYER